ncbi:MAG: GAF domain-containing protein [Elusimicrobiota bacterium]|jgi:GAF domain-containing protein|nr:GAF domain-containing protein [Elusimicrobiota bacterium]
MSESLIISTVSKKEKYEELLPQIESLIDSEDDLIAKMAIVAAALRQTFNFFWAGFYRVKGKELVLSPFQGDIACLRIGFAKGVCGTAWKERKTIIVPNVDEFPGHIACSNLSKSEIVIPVFCGDKIIAVLDIDSDSLNSFDETDRRYLEKIVSLI